jgi:hypothetical protein
MERSQRSLLPQYVGTSFSLLKFVVLQNLFQLQGIMFYHLVLLQWCVCISADLILYILRNKVITIPLKVLGLFVDNTTHGLSAVLSWLTVLSLIGESSRSSETTNQRHVVSNFLLHLIDMNYESKPSSHFGFDHIMLQDNGCKPYKRNNPVACYRQYN